MSRKAEFIKVARRAGVTQPTAQYNRTRKQWIISSTQPNGDGHYTDKTVGRYKSLTDARDRLAQDWQQFIDTLPEPEPIEAEFVDDDPQQDTNTPPAAIVEFVESPNSQLIEPAWFNTDGNAIREHKDSAYRVSKYRAWLDENGRTWLNTPLSDYRDYLLTTGRGNGEGYSAGTVSGHLSTVRARIRSLNTAQLRQDIYDTIPAGTSPADAKAFVDETLERLRLNVDPEHSKVKQATKQDTEDSAHVRLTAAQCDELVNLPDLDTLPGMRDAALLSLILATGIREAEAVALTMDDLRQTMGGELSLRITEGKGKKQRMVPYGENRFVLRIVDAWLARAGVTEGKVFRGFYKTPIDRKTGQPLPPKLRRSLSVRAVQQILEGYSVTGEDGQPVQVRPHDLRRSYARRQYEMGVDPVKIQQNLGHSDLKTTLGYIGTLDASARRGKKMFTFKGMNRLDRFTLEG